MSMDETDRKPRLGRRLLVLRVASLGAATFGSGCAVAHPRPHAPMARPFVTPVRTDADPYDAVGYGRGRTVTDNDPRDAAGYGRGYGGPPRRAVTDNDPRDAIGHGRGWR